MSYQHLSHPGHRLFSRQYCHNNPEILEEPDSFIDTVSFSESDGYIDILPKVRSVPSHDIQELYIRKPMLSTSQILPCAPPQGSRCCFNGYWTASPESMYEHPRLHYAINTGEAIPRRASSAYVTRRNAASVPDNLTAIQAGIHQNNIYSDTTSYKSTPTIPTGTPHKVSGEDRGIPRNKLSAAMAYKVARSLRPAVPISLLKKQKNFVDRQSASDPAKRPLKSQIPLGGSKSQEIRLSTKNRPDSFKCRTLPEMTDVKRKMDVKKMNSEGDATGFAPNIDALDTIERIVASLDENEVEELSEDHKNEIRRMSKFLAPRVPSSVKSSTTKQVSSKNEVMENVCVVTNPEDEPNCSLKKSLHNILDQLESCELSLNAVRAKYSADRQKAVNAGPESTQKKVKAEEIFNLREISEKMSAIPDDTKIDVIKDGEKQISLDNSVQANSDSTTQDPENVSSDFTSRIESKNSLDDIEALELHRSKSYIVNLIDRALSKELGTIPKERIERNQDEDLNTTRAINHIKRNYKQADTCQGTMEGINQAIDLIISPKDLNQHQSALNKDDQPTFIKQLKELRWGHFKHIQQEVRRLEDLERFLDTCGVSCDSTY